MIAIKDLNKTFGKNQVLSNLNLEINEQGVFAILGPNGSGKSTLIKSLLGLCIPDSGEIQFKGESVLKKHHYRNNIQYLPQIAKFPGNLKVKELIAMIKDLRKGASRYEEIIEKFALEESLNKKLHALSGGTRQKINLLLCFMFDGDLIILDEPTTGLDPKATVYLKQLIREEKDKGKTILITSHIMQFVEEISDELVYLLEGHIYFRGTPDSLKQKAETRDFEEAIASLTEQD